MKKRDMNRQEPLNVIFHGLPDNAPLRAGRLLWQDGRCVFEYDGDYLGRGIHLSPLQLEWQPGIQQPEWAPFDGLHGVFNDSLPDGWGLLLMDRALRSRGHDPATLTPLDRLAFLGSRTLGALSYEQEPYEPEEGGDFASDSGQPIDLHRLGSEATGLYEGKEGSLDEVLERHLVHGTSPGGARPKLLVGLASDGKSIVTGAGDLPEGYTHWLAKFPTGSSPKQQAEGRVECIYHQMATEAGIEMAPCQLHEPEQGAAFFLTQRFDRLSDNRRIHVHSVAGLMHADFRVPNLDYLDLMKLTTHLTHSHKEKLQQFKRMVFNVLAGNRDDHTKNFAFMLNDQLEWVCTPAYDLTFSDGMAGEHSMTVNGQGRNIAEADLLAVAEAGSITVPQARAAIGEVAAGVACWDELSRDHDIPAGLRKTIAKYHQIARAGIFTGA